MSGPPQEPARELLPGELAAQPTNMQMAAPAYRKQVGPADRYDLMAAVQFNLLTQLGLREHHRLLDIGCGSLRAGRLFIPYLKPGHYFGIEPKQWLIDEGIANELGQTILEVKRPTFSNTRDFTLTTFGESFDYLMAQSIFSHTSLDQMRRCLSEARQVMNPRAIFAATYVEDEDDYVGTEWVYPGRSTFRPETIAAVAQEQGLVCVPLEWHHPNTQKWVGYVHPGNEDLLEPAVDVESLRKQLTIARRRIATLEGHPLVRNALRLNRMFRGRGKRGTPE